MYIIICIVPALLAVLEAEEDGAAGQQLRVAAARQPL